MSNTLATIVEELRALRQQNERLTDRVADLEDDVEELEHEVTHLEDRIDELEADRDRLDALTEATQNKAGLNKARLEELQARELEKGAHLHTTLVDEHEIDVPDDRLERITKADDDVTCSYSDLLPIQQLARMDADMRRSAANALPTRLAAKLWKARTDPAVGDDPWEDGSKTVDTHCKASDLKHWIRRPQKSEISDGVHKSSLCERQQEGIRDTYAKKLVSRTIYAILDLSNHRLAVRKRTERKNGLEYTERRLILPTDADVPGAERRLTAAT